MATIFKAPFETGQLVTTRAVHDNLEREDFSKDIANALKRYCACDWGELCQEDKELNDSAVLNNNDRIVARYKTCIKDIYIITEWDRSATTVLFVNEY